MESKKSLVAMAALGGLFSISIRISTCCTGEKPCSMPSFVFVGNGLLSKVENFQRFWPPVGITQKSRSTGSWGTNTTSLRPFVGSSSLHEAVPESPPLKIEHFIALRDLDHHVQDRVRFLPVAFDEEALLRFDLLREDDGQPRPAHDFDLRRVHGRERVVVEGLRVFRIQQATLCEDLPGQAEAPLEVHDLVDEVPHPPVGPSLDGH